MFFVSTTILNKIKYLKGLSHLPDNFVRQKLTNKFQFNVPIIKHDSQNSVQEMQFIYL